MTTTTVKDFFAWSQWVDEDVLRPLSHIRGNWELTWDHNTRSYRPEHDSFAELLNQLIDELDACDPPSRYHNNEDVLGECVQRTLNWGIKKVGRSWVGSHDNRLTPPDYIAMLQQGAFDDERQANLVQAAAGRIQAAIMLGQTHFDQLEQSHQYMLAGVLASILYHRAFQ
jgi:hypothetical protein